MSHPRILVAGIGNIFLGDDAFGVEVADRLARRDLPEAVRVVDFGIRGLDVTYALLDPYETVILVDAAPRGELPGALYVMEPRRDELPTADGARALISAHGMDPVKVIQVALAMDSPVEHLLLVGCEPGRLGELEEMQAGLSDPVRQAVDQAVELIVSLVDRLLRRESLELRRNHAIPGSGVGLCQD